MQFFHALLLPFSSRFRIWLASSLVSPSVSKPLHIRFTSCSCFSLAGFFPHFRAACRFHKYSCSPNSSRSFRKALSRAFCMGTNSFPSLTRPRSSWGGITSLLRSAGNRQGSHPACGTSSHCGYHIFALLPKDPLFQYSVSSFPGSLQLWRPFPAIQKEGPVCLFSGCRCVIAACRCLFICCCFIF